MGKRKDTETETIQVRIPVFKNVHVLTLRQVNGYALRHWDNVRSAYFTKSQ